MSTESIATASAPIGVRILAVLLILGGIIGIGLSIWMAILGMEQPAFAIVAIVFAAVFTFTTWQGVKLWQNRPEAYKWSKILFAAQVPAFSVGGITYGFFTLVGFNVQLGAGVELFDFSAGSALNVLYSPEAPPTFVGVNLIAAAACAYLHFSTRSGNGQRVSVRNEAGA